MALIDLAELPPALAEVVSPQARLTFPPQGKTSDVAFAAGGGRSMVVKRCAHRIYLDWLRREQFALRALAESDLPVPRFIAYAEAETNGQTVGWLLMSRLAGTPFLGAATDARAAQQVAMFRQLGELVRRLHGTRVPGELRHTGSWLSRQIERARGNLAWCDGTATGLAELERTRPPSVREALIHGDLALDNVLVDEHGALSLIDWADGGLGDPRHDIALALQTKPELDLSADALDAFFAGYGTAALGNCSRQRLPALLYLGHPCPRLRCSTADIPVRVDEATRDWFVRLYDFF